MNANAWREGVFAVLVRGERGPEQRHIAGYVNGLFAIDRRQYWDDNTDVRQGWIITHLPTGFVMRGVKGGFNTAKKIAEAIAAAADWDFSDADKAKALGSVLKPIMKDFPACTSANDFLHPKFVEAPASVDRSAEGGETRSEAKGLDPKDESAVGAEGAETPNPSSNPPRTA